MRFDTSQAFTHICNLFPEPWPGGVLIEIAKKQGAVDHSIQGSFLLERPEDIHKIPQHLLDAYVTQQCNFYFACGFVDGRKTKNYFLRKKDNITHVSALWADVDNIDLARAKQIETECPCPPSGYVRSGGGYHFYWALQEPYDASDARIVEGLKKVEGWTGADCLAKITQILGLPGGYRFKLKYSEPPPVYIEKWTRGIIYDIDEILKHKITINELKVDKDFAIKYILGGELIAGEKGEQGKRSTRDFVIIKELLKSGHTREDVWAVFKNEAFACSSKVLEHNGENYLTLTYTNALAEVKVAGDDGIGVVDNGKVVIRKKVDAKGNITEDIISNFVIIPQELHIYEDQSFGLVVVVDCDGLRRTSTVNSRDLNYRSNFLGAAGIPGMAWTGSEQDFMAYIGYVRSQLTEDKRYPATRISGWFKGCIMTEKHKLGKNRDQLRYLTKGAAPRVVLNRSDVPFADFMKEVYEHLLKLNSPRVSFFTFGWFAAALFAPQIREALNRQFPILCLSGEPGSGKTTTALVLNKALCGVVSDYTYQGSAAAMRRVFGSTNCFPVFMDEYEAGDRAVNIDAYLRYAWQMGTVPRCVLGNSNWDSVDDLPLIAPICVGTVTSITDEALRDRMLYIRVRMHERPKDPAGINWFRTIPPGFFARRWFREPVKEIIASIKHCIAAYELQYPQATDRQAIAEGVAIGVLEYCSHKYWDDKWDWKVAQTVAEEEAKIVAVSKETPENLLDILLSYMLRNPGMSSMYPDKDWRIEVATYAPKVVLIFHQSHFYAKCGAVARTLQLPRYVERKWLQSTISDLVSAKKVIRTSYSCRIAGSVVSSAVFDLAFFPLTNETAEEMMTDRGAANYV